MRNLAKISCQPRGGSYVTTIDYAGAVPCTFRTAARTTRWDPTTNVPLEPADVSSTSAGGSSYYGSVTNGQNQPLNNATYDGVIVRCPWRWMGTDAATGKQLGTTVTNVPNPVKIAQIIDGTSKTLLIGEKYIRSDRYDDSRYSDDRGWADGWDADSMRSSCFLPIQDSDPIGWGAMERYFGDQTLSTGGYNGLYNVLHFGSAHTAGIQAVFVDGAVRIIGFDVDIVVFNSLAPRNGEEQIPASFN